MADILDRLDEMNESGVIAYDVYSELHDLASQLEERKVEKIEQILKDYNVTMDDLTNNEYDYTDLERDIIREVLEQE